MAARLTRKAIGGNPIKSDWFGEIGFSDQERKDAGLEERSKDFVWFPLILSICRESAKKDSSIQRSLSKLYQEFGGFADKWVVAIQKSRHELDPLQRFFSIKWKNRILYIGCCGGGYRPFTELYTHFPELSASIPSDDC